MHGPVEGAGFGQSAIFYGASHSRSNESEPQNTCRSADLIDWCRERCEHIERWLGLGLPWSSAYEPFWLENTVKRVWDICSHGQLGMWFARALLMLRTSDGSRSETTVFRRRGAPETALPLLGEAEHLLRQLLVSVSQNLTRYLNPAYRRVGLFVHASRFVHAVRLIEHEKGIRTRGAESTSDREQLSMLQESIMKREVPLRTGHAVIDQTCLLTSAVLLLATADGARISEQGVGRRSGVGLGKRTKRLLDKGQRCLQHTLQGQMQILGVATATAASLLDVLDRLESSQVVPLNNIGNKRFWMHLLPFRSIESDFVRSNHRFYCDAIFAEFADQLFQLRAARHAAGYPVHRFQLVEVGAHLGSCTFLALVRLSLSEGWDWGAGTNADAVAVEPYSAAANALRSTAAENGLAGEVTVIEKCVGATNETYQDLGNADPIWQVSSSERESYHAFQKPCMSLSDLLQPLGFGDGRVIHLLRVNVNGNELSVLQSATRLFGVGAVVAVAISMLGKRDPHFTSQDVQGIVRILQQHHFTLWHEGVLFADEKQIVARARAQDFTTTLIGLLESERAESSFLI